MLKHLIFNKFRHIFRAMEMNRENSSRITDGVKSTILTFFLLCATALSSIAQIPDGVYPNTVDAQGKKQGAWKKKDENGIVVYVGQFKDDKPYGLFTYFDTEGKKMTEMNFLQGGAVAYAKMFYADGKVQAEGKYVNQKKDSLWKFYNADGLFLSEETWVLGKKEGKVVVYHPGTTQPASVTFFKNGLEDGQYTEYYADGKKKMEVKYVAGNMEGTAIWYFPDGRINILGAYQHAVKHGKWTYYNADGTIKGTETWNAGKMTSQEQLIKPEEMNKTIEDPQNPNHDAGGGN